MIRLRTICYFFCTVTFSVCAQVNLEWTARYNGIDNLRDRGFAIAVDDSGFIYVTGVSLGAITDRDYITIKYTPSGDTVWVRLFNGPENGFDVARDIAIDDSGNVYVTGTSVMGTMKYDKDGNEIWFRRFGQFSAGYRIDIDKDGSIYVAGESNNNYATVKYDTEGNQLWAHTYNGPGNLQDRISDIVIDNNDDVIVTGRSRGTVTDYDIATIKYSGSTGDTLWLRRYNGPSPSQPYDSGDAITVDDRNNVYVTGWSDGINGAAQCIVIKYSSDGELLWERRFPPGGGYGMAGYDIINDPSGYIYAAARSHGNEDRLFKYDYEGNLMWTKQYIAAHLFATNPPRLALDIFGNVYMSSANSSEYAYYIILKYDPDGNQLFEYRYHEPPVSGSLSINAAYDIHVDADMNIYLTGESLVSGMGTDFDILTIKLSQDSTTSVQGTAIIPSAFKLLPAYPNPFNSSTNITFTLPYSSDVGMKIYNILGEEITTLISEYRTAGFHTINWDAGDLPSGLYLGKLQAGSNHGIVKILLIR
ncbi:MAG: SBBP repeat-containing protein [Ignavibacterium sp.]|nr:SBBP repeat-containing protein [Ignavibacterium sp.]